MRVTAKTLAMDMMLMLASFPISLSNLSRQDFCQNLVATKDINVENYFVAKAREHQI